MGRTRNYVMKVYCKNCDTLLFKYLKEGEGHLVKCYLENILEDHTEEPMICPTCGETFAREAYYHHRKAYKIIQGRVYTKT